MRPVEVHAGAGPIVLGLPHTGTFVPEDILGQLNENGRILADTDWHIHELYEGLLPDATTVRATFHRYVIDANRDPSGESLYPGKNTTGLVPVTDFDNQPIWITQPDDEDIQARLVQYHRAYHQALETELNRVRKKYGVVILYDCHSIRSRIPHLFDGVLPDFNIGTNGGTTCSTEIATAVARICQKAKGYTSVINGRFKGGWTTRHYGKPEKGIHAVQMELAQSTHLQTEAPPFAYSQEKAEQLRGHLGAILNTLNGLAVDLSKHGCETS